MFAAYDDYSIYAVAETAEAAIAKARQDAREPEAVFETAPISDADAAWIEENGFDGMVNGFEVDGDGIVLHREDGGVFKA